MNNLFSCLVIIMILSSFSSCGQENNSGHADMSNYLVPFRQGSLIGLSDGNGKIVVPCKYPMLIWNPPYFRAMDKDRHVVSIFNINGKQVKGDYPLPEYPDTTETFVFGNGFLTNRLYDSQYIPSWVGKDINYRLVPKTKKNLSWNEAKYQLVDTLGNIILPSVSEIMRLSNGMLIVRNKDTITRKTIDIGVYDYRSRKFSYKNSDPRNKIGFFGGFMEIVDMNQVHHYMTWDGREIMRSDTMQQTVSREELIVGFSFTSPDSSRYAGMIVNRAYHAIRSHTSQPFTVYDDAFNVINTKYTSLLSVGTLRHWIAFQSRGKWGLLNYLFKPEIPEISDSVVYVEHDRYAVVERKSTKYRIDLINKDTIWGDYDWLSPVPVQGKSLAVRYIKEEHPRAFRLEFRAENLYLIDKAGKATDSFNVHETNSYLYLLTPNGQILSYPDYYPINDSEREVKLYGKGIKKLPYKFEKLITSYDKALAIECRNVKDEIGLVSALDFSIIVPFAKYERISAFPFLLPPRDGKGKGLEGIFLYAQTGGHEIIPFGFYSILGKKYWKD